MHAIRKKAGGLCRRRMDIGVFGYLEMCTQASSLCIVFELTSFIRIAVPRVIMPEETRQELKDIVDKAEISLILDTYDDIFSDFDPRPYDQRTLSEDFISEAKKAARDKTKGIELRFMIPQGLRSERSEALIKLRLKDYFRKSYRRAGIELSRQGRQAMMLVGVGAVIGFVDAFLLSLNGSSTVLRDAVEIILTPASWYTIWTGFDRLLMRPKDMVADREFFRKMAGAQITFTPY